MENKEIKAETWLSVHHPSQKEWIARKQGVFIRNYSNDLHSCIVEEDTVELSRDGLYETLPHGVFFTGRELNVEKKSDFQWVDKVMHQRVKRIKTTFLPFDSSYFNHSLALENELNESLSDKTEIMLRDFFGLDLSNERNPYIRTIAPMIAQAARIRGDFRFLCKVISCILGFKTDVKVTRKKVRFIVNRPNLDKATLLQYLDELKPFFLFVEEWFIPFELQCEFKVRDYTRDDHFTGPNKLMLDYNATLGNKPEKTTNES